MTSASAACVLLGDGGAPERLPHSINAREVGLGFSFVDRERHQVRQRDLLQRAFVG